jgi:transcriptional regulator with XRE-family HTH domain
MPRQLEERMAQFLKERRGAQTYAAFAKKLGLPPSTLFRLENCHQSPTLRLLEQILEKLKCSYQDVFDTALPKPAALHESSRPTTSSPPRQNVSYRKGPKKK